MKARLAKIWIPALLLLGGCLLEPEAVFAADGGGDRWGVLLTVGRFVNLVIVIAVVVWAARKPLVNFYAERTQSIRGQLSEAQKARAEAESKLAEMQSRMSRLDDELRELKAAAEREAREEYGRLIAGAEQDVDKIVRRVGQEIDGMTRAARLDLREHVAELSVQLAEEKIRSEITDEDRSRLFARFVTKLGEKE